MAGSRHGLGWRKPVLPDLDIDPIQQDDRVVDHDAGQRDDPQDGEEAEDGTRCQQSEGDAHQAERDGQQDHDGLAQAVELGHQEEQDDHPGNGQLYGDGGIGLPGGFRLPADSVGVPRGPRRGVPAEPREQLPVDLPRSDTREQLGLDGQGTAPVAALDDGGLPDDLQVRNLFQRNGAAPRRIHRQGPQPVDVPAVGGTRTHDDRHKVVFLPKSTQFDT